LKANEDIDYVVWGPYDSVVDAIALCNGGIEESSLVDCGYTSTNEEVINITNAIAGQTYILLVTNYKDDIQNMTLSKASGDADTDCSSYLRSLNTDAPSESPSNSPIDSPSESPSNSAIDSLAPSETPSEYPSNSLTFTNSPSSSPTCAKTVNTGCDIDSDCACLKKCTHNLHKCKCMKTGALLPDGSRKGVCKKKGRDCMTEGNGMQYWGCRDGKVCVSSHRPNEVTGKPKRWGKCMLN